jgi:hypothetical protein
MATELLDLGRGVSGEILSMGAAGISPTNGKVRRPGHLEACPTLTGRNVADGDGWLSDLVLCSVRTGSEYISSTPSYRASQVSEISTDPMN